jgi:hypothetical protein
MQLLTKWFGFGGDDLGFLKEVVKTYLMAPMSPCKSPIVFFFICTPIVYAVHHAT